MSRQITEEIIDGYRDYLYWEEKAAATIKKYVREVGLFASEEKRESGEPVPFFSYHSVFDTAVLL